MNNIHCYLHKEIDSVGPGTVLTWFIGPVDFEIYKCFWSILHTTKDMKQYITVSMKSIVIFLCTGFWRYFLPSKQSIILFARKNSLGRQGSVCLPGQCMLVWLDHPIMDQRLVTNYRYFLNVAPTSSLQCCAIIFQLDLILHGYLGSSSIRSSSNSSTLFSTCLERMP
jgi:hypothetical protein